MSAPPRGKPAPAARGRNPKKTAGNSGTRTPGERIPQPHGGALLAGGVPGNAGGPGRPTKETRERLRELAESRFNILTEIADGEVRLNVREACEFCGKAPTRQSVAEQISVRVPKPADRLTAIATMLRFGLGERHETISAEWVSSELAKVRRIIRQAMPAEEADNLLARIARETFQQ